MADGTVAPGTSTSEFKLTAVVMLVGSILDGAGILLDTMKQGGLTPSWLPAVLVVVGSLMVVAKALGYTRSRTLLKMAELQTPGAQAVAATAPFVRQVVELVKAELRGPQTPPDAPPGMAIALPPSPPQI